MACETAASLSFSPLFTFVPLEHTYEGLIENQPIGKSLFEEFCSTEPTLAKCHEFIKAVDEFVLIAEEKGAVTAGKIFDDFLSPQVC